MLKIQEKTLEFPKLTGKFSVGRKHYYWVNTNEKNPYYHNRNKIITEDNIDIEIQETGENEEFNTKQNLKHNEKVKHSKHRELLIQIWYPSNKKEIGKSKYQRKIPEYPELNDYILISHTYEEQEFIPCSTTKQNFPVIIFAHGYGESVDGYTMFLENITSHGYIVVGINHTYVCNVFMPVVLDSQNFGEQYKTREIKCIAKLNQHLLDVCFNDIKFVLSKINELNKSDHILKGKLDITKIGVLCHSLGGMNMQNALREIPDLKVGAFLDAAMTANFKQVNKPLLFLESEWFHETNMYLAESDPDWANLRIHKQTDFYKDLTKYEFFLKFFDKFFCSNNNIYRFFLKKSGHNTFTNLQFLKNTIIEKCAEKRKDLEKFQYLGIINSQIAIKIINEFIIDFFDKFLKDKNLKFLNKAESSDVLENVIKDRNKLFPLEAFETFNIEPDQNKLFQTAFIEFKKKYIYPEHEEKKIVKKTTRHQILKYLNKNC